MAKLRKSPLTKALEAESLLDRALQPTGKHEFIGKAELNIPFSPYINQVHFEGHRKFHRALSGGAEMAAVAATPGIGIVLSNCHLVDLANRRQREGCDKGNGPGQFVTGNVLTATLNEFPFR